MVFASLTFLYLFLPATLLAYFAAPSIRARNVVLTAASLAFYAWGEPVWVVLLILSSSIDYGAALLIERLRGTRWKWLGLTTSLVTNLGVLALFKYGGMFVGTINALLHTSLPAPSFGLPVGISFYTFQALSYVIDVHRGQVRAARSYLDFLLFISLFHQLVAGPIVRYADVAGEIRHRTHDLATFNRGLTRLAVGLAKKVFIANVAGELVLKHLDAPTAGLASADVWLGTVAFTLQIYFDFSGYSDMAIGLGLMNGFHYGENFDHPYVATSVGEFWRRWHISLGTFFRDYVYIPLGGNRASGLRNLFAVWFLTGLWHGAAWNFVVWGLFHGYFIALERLGLAALLRRLPAIVSHLYLLLVVMVGWLIFHCEEFGRMTELLRLGFGLTRAPVLRPDVFETLRSHALWLPAALLLCLPVRAWLLERWQRLEARAQLLAHLRDAGALVLQASSILLATAQLVGRSYNPFLYFRF